MELLSLFISLLPIHWERKRATRCCAFLLPLPLSLSHSLSLPLSLSPSLSLSLSPSLSPEDLKDWRSWALNSTVFLLPISARTVSARPRNKTHTHTHSLSPCLSLSVSLSLSNIHSSSAGNKASSTLGLSISQLCAFIESVPVWRLKVCDMMLMCVGLFGVSLIVFVQRPAGASVSKNPQGRLSFPLDPPHIYPPSAWGITPAWWFLRKNNFWDTVSPNTALR